MLKFIMSFLLAMFSSSVVLANTISGTISLPTGVSAGASGVTFEVQTFPLRISFVNGSFVISSDTVTIPAGSSSASYNLQIEDDSTLDERVEFECTAGCASLGITTGGFWSETEGVVNLFDATDYSSLSNHVVNIVTEVADVFSGKIKFPEGFTAIGGITEQLVLRVSSNDFLSLGFANYIFPEAGENEWNFSVGVPKDQTPSAWTITLSCNTCDAGITVGDHFTTTISGDPLSLDESNAFSYQKDNNYSNMSLTLIPTQPPEEDPNLVIAPIIYLLQDEE